MSDDNGVKIKDQEKKSSKSVEDINKENKKLEKDLEKKSKLSDVLKEKEARKKKSEDDMSTVMLVDQADRSVNLGVVGVGQCGSKIAEEFYKRGYNTVAINTALQDLKHIHIPEKQKLFLDYALGGAAKDLDTGRAAAEQYAEEVAQHIQNNLQDCDILLLAAAGGGGTGAGSAETMVNIMSQLGTPMVVLYVLPLSSEDSLAKHNAVHTLSKLARLAKDDTINSLIIVDNAKIELMFPGKSMAEFWRIANNSIVEPLHLFNELSANPSEYTSLDPMDFSRVLVGEGDCSLYGMIEVEEYMEDEAIAEAMITSLETGLLSADFDLSQTRSAGIIIVGNKEVLNKVPATNIEYGFAMVSKICNEGTRIFRGVYEVPSEDDVLKVYSFFSGLGLPEERVAELKAEAERHMEILSKKESGRASAMTIDIGKTNTTSAADAMHKKIKNKHSAMGKLMKNSKRIVDRRRR